MDYRKVEYAKMRLDAWSPYKSRLALEKLIVKKLVVGSDHIHLFRGQRYMPFNMVKPHFSVYTLSLGKHIPLPIRLQAAASAGFTHIELDTEDWYTHARGFCVEQGLKFEDGVAQAAAAKALLRDTSSLGMTILCLQPLRHFEGLLDENTRADRFKEATALLRVMVHLQTDLLLIPSSFLPPQLISGDRSRIISDFRELAGVAASIDRKLRIGYEALAWGTYVDTWQDAWAVVQGVDRPNFGLILDSFNVLGRVYADPTNPNGVQDEAEMSYRASLDELTSTVPASRIFLLQIADGARLKEPIDKSADLPRLQWSRTSRLFPGERDRGAYLPVDVFMRTVVHDVGFKGAWSVEYFNADLERRENGEQVAKELADRAAHSLAWLLKEVYRQQKGTSNAAGITSIWRPIGSVKRFWQELGYRGEVKA